MRVTSRGEYGVRALFDLAVHYGHGPIPLKSIAERQNISDHYLEQLMAAMRKQGLVKSVRGAFGGYELRRAPKEITIGEVIRVLEGPILAQSEDDDDNEPMEMNQQAIRSMWAHIAQKINDVLDCFTLAD